MDIGNILKEIRLSKKLTQVAVSKKIKLSQTSLSQIEGNVTQPSKTNFRKLCKLYGVPYQVVVWKSITIKDIPPKNRELFNKLSPIMDTLISEILK